MTRIVFLDRDTIGPTVEITRPCFDHVRTEILAFADILEQLAQVEGTTEN